MLIGRSGKFILKPPFNVYTDDGLSGTIVGINYIRHALSKGVNVRETVYEPVTAGSLYSSDLANNVLIVTIKTSNGTKYDVPDIYIENLYDDSLNYVDAYVTIKIGKMPLNYDFSYIKTQVAAEATKASGVSVSVDDVFVSASESGEILTRDEAAALDVTRAALLNTSTSVHGQLLAAAKKSAIDESKISSLEAAVLNLLG